MINKRDQVTDSRNELARGLLKGVFPSSVVFHGRWVGKTPVDLLRIVRKERAHLSNAVADRDDKVKGLVGELVEMFRALLADINPHPRQDTHRIGMHFGRVAASATDRDTAAAEVPQDALGHLRTRTIVRTKEQYPRGMVRILGC